MGKNGVDSFTTLRKNRFSRLAKHDDDTPADDDHFLVRLCRGRHALNIGLSVRTKNNALLSRPASNIMSKSCLFAFMFLLFTFRFNVRQFVYPFRRRSAYSAKYRYLFPTTTSLDVIPSSDLSPVRKLNMPISYALLLYYFEMNYMNFSHL